MSMTRRSAVIGSSLAVAVAILMGISPASGGTPSQEVPSGRGTMGLAQDPNGRILLFGGYEAENSRFLGDTWTWDGSTWTEQHPPTSPRPRCCFQTAYDAARRQVVLFGGYTYPGQGYLGDTWTWDGSTWTEQHPAHRPPTASNYGMAYDEAAQRVVVFMGGVDRTMWGWDGVDWARLRPRPSPKWRELPGFTYDGARQELVMFGGAVCDELCYAYDDTWTWDRVAWHREDPRAIPRDRLRMGMTYDAARRRVVLFGGEAVGGFANDTWTWDGRTWKRVFPSSSPSPREALAMAWDGEREQVVLFGGRDFLDLSYRDFNDTWVGDGVTWTCVSACP
jgi:hypothetical protein